MNEKDELFSTTSSIQDFTFDEEVAGVFDDMITRSVPFYQEIQRITVDLATTYLKSGGNYYDVGCSTGTTINLLAEQASLPSSVKLIGIEPSEPMSKKAREKLVKYQDKVQLINTDVQSIRGFDNAKVVAFLYTLQFIRPIERLQVLKTVYNSILPGGCIIVGEKILADETTFRRLFIDKYHQYKQTKEYTSLEINKKRESLENVLIPFTNLENIQLLQEAGFSNVEQVFRWYNFALYVATKPDCS